MLRRNLRGGSGARRDLALCRKFFTEHLLESRASSCCTIIHRIHQASVFSYYYVPGISHALLHSISITDLQEGDITGQRRHSKFEGRRNAPKITKTGADRARISSLAPDHSQFAGSISECSFAFASRACNTLGMC